METKTLLKDHLKDRQRQLLVLTCILILTLSLATRLVFAAEATLAAQIDTRAYKPGDTFTANLILSDNPGFAGMALKISYPKGIEATHIRPIGKDPLNMREMLDLISGLTLPEGWESDILPVPIADHFFLVWGRSTNYVASATLFEVTFRVTADAHDGENLINIAFGSAQGPCDPVNLAEQKLNIRTTPGIVKITGSTPVWGDFTNNINVDGTDVLWIQRYTTCGRSIPNMLKAYNTSLTDFNERAADFTNDGNVDGTDVLWILRFVASGRNAVQMLKNYNTTIDFSHLF